MGDMSLSTPKPMLPVAGKPILQRQIEALAKEGVRDFTIVAGHLHEKITDYFGDGSSFGAYIRYFIEETPLGTGGALKKLGLKEDFLLLGGDLLFDICLGRFREFHAQRGALITLYAHPNSHPFDSVLLRTDPETSSVVGCGRYPEDGDGLPNLCNAGIEIVSPAALDLAADAPRLDFDRDILAPNIAAGRVFAYRNTETVMDVGTPERLAAAEELVRSGLPEKRRADRSHKAVFLDRDGTINVFRGDVKDPDELELIPGAAEALRLLRRAGYLLFVITNQPVVARGLCSEEDLGRIHNRLERLLGEEGAYVDDIFYCPHHPKAGFPGENRRYKIPCLCRKPQPGLIERAAERYGIDLAASFMVGDSPVDVETALNAGCSPVYLRCGLQPETEPRCERVFDDLIGFARSFEY